MSRQNVRAAVAPESLLENIDERRVRVSATLDPRRRKNLGQFMTPEVVAGFMASLIEPVSKPVRVLDPGAGIGTLSLAAINELCSRRLGPSRIDLVAVEVDPKLQDELELSIDKATAFCEASSVELRSQIIQADFIEYACSALDTQLGFEPIQLPRFDVIVLNPPYRKLHSTSRERKRLEAVGIDATNLYSAFLALSARLLSPEGQIIAITPRSFCNGRYFLNFRRQFTSHLAFTRVHVVESRSEAFADDDVLQENIIFHAVRDRRPDSVIVTSGGVSKDAQRVGRKIPYEKLISPADPDLFIHLPHDPRADEVTRFVRALPCRLDDLGIGVSTGRVVDFRSVADLRNNPEPGTVPLIYPTHMCDGFVSWPKSGKKPNALAVSEESAPLLVPVGDYVLVKRFTAKEEARRVVAAVCRQEDLPACEGFGFENHLNYYHANNRPLDRDLAIGLAAFLNSRVVDEFFRQFSGHTQVNAGDLRKLHYPSLEALRQVGKHIDGAFPCDTEIDQLLGAPVYQNR